MSVVSHFAFSLKTSCVCRLRRPAPILYPENPIGQRVKHTHSTQILLQIIGYQYFYVSIDDLSFKFVFGVLFDSFLSFFMGSSRSWPQFLQFME